MKPRKRNYPKELLEGEHRVYIEIGLKIHRRRRQLGWTQEALGEKVGLSRTSITHMESGEHHATLHMLYRLSTVLGFEPEALVAGTRP